MNNPPEERSPIAVATEWSSRIMTVSLEMVLPGILGYWADTRLGTLPLLIFVGFAIGMTSAIWHLIRMTRPAETGDSQNSDSASSPSESHEESDRK